MKLVYPFSFVLAFCLIACVALKRVQADDVPDVDGVVTLLDLVIDADEAIARKCLGVLTAHVQNGSLPQDRIAKLKEQLGERLQGMVSDSAHPLQFDAALLSAAWNDPAGLKLVRQVALDAAGTSDRRLAAYQALVAARDTEALTIAREVLSQTDADSSEFKSNVLAGLGRFDDARVATLLLEQFEKLPGDLKPKAIEVLTQRPLWSLQLLQSIADKKIAKELLNVNQLRRVASFKDEVLQAQFKELYGTLRDGRNPNREQVFWKMRDFLGGTPGDPVQGEAVFKKVCAQCHKIYGEGAEVGPDITRNGRNNWDQLLMNVFDPSAVIGPGYQARMLATTDGRILTGLPVEESDQQVVLKIQGGKIETIPRDQIDEYKVSELSLMPEELEKQLTPQQLADLFAFLALDQPPGNPDAKLLNGAPSPKSR